MGLADIIGLRSDCLESTVTTTDTHVLWWHWCCGEHAQLLSCFTTAVRNFDPTWMPL